MPIAAPMYLLTMVDINMQEMTKIAALIVLFLTCVWDCSAVSDDGILYPFPLNTLLTCHVPNPLAGKPGEEDSIPEDTLRLQLQPPTTPGQLVWTPVSSGYVQN